MFFSYYKIKRFVLASAMIVMTTLSMASTVQANEPTQIMITAGGGTGMVELSNPVQFKGMTKDNEGIKMIHATVQSAETNEYVDVEGNLTAEQSNIKVRFDEAKSLTRWHGPVLTLPAGEYLFSISVEDDEGVISSPEEVTFRVSEAT